MSTDEYSKASGQAAKLAETVAANGDLGAFYANLGGTRQGTSVTILDGSAAGMVSNQVADGFKDYRFEEGHVVYYEQDAGADTAHRVILKEADEAWAQQGKDFAVEYFKQAVYLAAGEGAGFALGKAIGAAVPFLSRLGRAAESATGAFSPGARLGGDLGIFAERELTVTPKGLDLVRGHLAQFGDVPANTAMLERLDGAMASGQRVTGADAIFYTHEAAEATMMGRGLSYDAAHAAALDKYGVSPFSVYHPDVIRAMPEHFNSNWYKFWGIKP